MMRTVRSKYRVSFDIESDITDIDKVLATLKNKFIFEIAKISEEQKNKTGISVSCKVEGIKP